MRVAIAGAGNVGRSIAQELIDKGHTELYRDPTSTVAIIETPVNPAWIGHPLHVLEEATGTRAAFVMRFGIGTLTTASTVLQDGDQVFMLVTDEIADAVTKIAAAPPAAV